MFKLNTFFNECNQTKRECSTRDTGHNQQPALDIWDRFGTNCCDTYNQLQITTHTALAAGALLFSISWSSFSMSRPLFNRFLSLQSIFQFWVSPPPPQASTGDTQSMWNGEIAVVKIPHPLPPRWSSQATKDQRARRRPCNRQINRIISPLRTINAFITIKSGGGGTTRYSFILSHPVTVPSIYLYRDFFWCSRLLLLRRG